MKKEFLFLLLVLEAFAAMAQADYRLAGGRFRDFYNRQQSDSIFFMYSSNVQQMLPPDKNKQFVTQLYGQYGVLESAELIRQDTAYGIYKAVFDHVVLKMILALDKNGRIAGIHFAPYQQEASTGGQQGPSSGGQQHSFSEGRPDPAAEGPMNGGSNNNVHGRSNISLKTEGGNIYGTLEMVPGNRRVPVVLIIAGSGPTDRDGNSGADARPNMYKMLADSLLLHGIASLRYDKRGVGESKAVVKSEASGKFEDLVDDAAGFIKMLKADHRFSKVIVLGHSEGSLIGMIAAGRTKSDAFISVAGPGERIDKIIERQLAAQSPQLAAEATVIFDSLGRGYAVQKPDQELLFLFRPSVQPYLMSWLRYDPREEIKKLAQPVMILQGATDIQVSIQDAQLLKKAKPDAVLKLVAGMNHILKQASADRQKNMATYSMPDLPLDAELVGDIAAFVHSDAK